MIKISELKNGIELCLDNGKRLLDDAVLLQENRKYQTAIPLFILAYEEINKGVFLEHKLHKKEEVSDDEYDKIFGGRSHSTKNKMYFAVTKAKLQELDDKEFLTMKSVTESKSKITWHASKNEAMRQADGGILLVTKFNRIKKEFLYVDFVKQKWYSNKNRFSEKALNSLCVVLHYTTLEPYFKTKFYLDLYKMGFYWNTIQTDSPDEKRIFQNINSLEIEKIESFFKTVKWRNALGIATKMIELFSDIP